MLTEGTYLIYDPNRGSDDKVITAKTHSDRPSTVELDRPERFTRVRDQRWHITPDLRGNELRCTIKNLGTNKFLAYKEGDLRPLDPVELVDSPCYWRFTVKGDDKYSIRPIDEYDLEHFILATRFGTVEIDFGDDSRETTHWKLKRISDHEHGLETNEL